MEWPKMIPVRGVMFPVSSWEEFEELVARVGGQSSGGTSLQDMVSNVFRRGELVPSDRTLLQRFVDNGRRGMLNSELGPALNTRGRGIAPALEEWSRRIGLVSGQGGSAFEPTNMGVLGRGYRITDLAAETARALLGQEGGAS